MLFGAWRQKDADCQLVSMNGSTSRSRQVASSGSLTGFGEGQHTQLLTSGKVCIAVMV
jgi:hypothetical protein